MFALKNPKIIRWFIVVNCSLLFLMAMLFRASTVIISPELSRDLDLSLESLGLLGSIFFYAFAAAQLPMGLLLDKFGPRRSLICLNLIGTLGALIFARAQGLSGGLLARALLGLGMFRGIQGLRWISLAFLLVTIGKVFLYDLGQLRDLYRVASLVGLAVSLILVSLLKAHR